MTSLARISVLTILAMAAAYASALAATNGTGAPNGTAFPLCQTPLTKGYQLQPGFCAPQVAAMIPHAVDSNGCCECCGPFGIPPIFAAGNNVVVRTTPEVHERVARFLIDLGAYVPLKPK